MANDFQLNLPLTIEKQLEKYAMEKGHTERHATLWHAWYQNKKWIGQLLQSTLFSFPTYSKHDETHALAVLNNIEMILGQERIAALSATDCFVILHTVYIHDIGMCILQRDRKEIIENDAFVEMLDYLEQEGEDKVKASVKLLKKENYDIQADTSEHFVHMKELYRAKLDVFYAMMEMLASFRRSEHGNISAQRLYEWVKKPEKLGTGFSMAGVPLRIFLAIARCAQMHTEDNFDDIKELPRKDGGYASDYYHPRFAAVLLMLGDILDMDNDRFHPMAHEFVEDFSEISQSHFDKHRAIRRLHISPEYIEIEADCDNQNALRLVRKECDMLTSILKNAGYLWTMICPEKFQGSLPTVRETNLYLKGQKIPEELVSTQFYISQEKAFSILEGSNLYGDHFVFIREFLQNAIDATKMQYFFEYKGMSAFYYQEGQCRELSPNQMNAELALEKYPIEICMKMQKRLTSGDMKEVSDDEMKYNRFTMEDGVYGILVSIKDFGTGIGKERIAQISKVGNSRKSENESIRKMPEWLRPTAEFGVGLQSAFLMSDSFKCVTRTRSEEYYEITFSSGASRRFEGYINVAPKNTKEDDIETYGTRFEVFVPLEKKFLHSESECTWSGRDPFSEDYDASRPRRHAIEMASQMVLYIDGLLGELLFPVIVRTENIQLPEKVGKQINKVRLYNNRKYHKEEKFNWMFEAEKDKEHKRYWYGEIDEAIYALDKDNASLCIWNKLINTAYIVSGVNVLQNSDEKSSTKECRNDKKGIPVYYKGIELQNHCYEDEIEVFELIDIKGALSRENINISRRGFTQKGLEYFHNVIYPELISAMKKILLKIDSDDKDNSLEDLKNDMEATLADLKKEYDCNQKGKEHYGKLKKFVNQATSLSMLAHLAIKDEWDDILRQREIRNGQIESKWQKLVVYLSKELLKYPEQGSIREELSEYSFLFNMRCIGVEKPGRKTLVLKWINILDLFREDRHYAMYQERNKIHGTWNSFVVDVTDFGFFQETDHPLSIYNAIENCIQKSACEEELEQFMQDLLIGRETSGGQEDLSNFIIPQGMTEETILAKQQFLNTWLEINIPIIALVSDRDGNRRLNFLSHYVYPSVYVNQHMKRLVVERLIQSSEDKKIERFSTFSWQRHHFISLKTLPFSAYFIKRGHMNRRFLNKVIFPFSRMWLEKIRAGMENDKQGIIEKVEKWQKGLDIQQYIRKLNDEKEKDLPMLPSEVTLMGELERLAKESECSINDSEIINDLKELMRDILLQCEELGEKDTVDDSSWRYGLQEILKVYIRSASIRSASVQGDDSEKVIESNLAMNNLIKEVTENIVIRDMAQKWRILNAKKWNDLMPSGKLLEIQQEYREECQKSMKREREQIFSFICKNAAYPVKMEQIRECYYAFEEEIFGICREIEKIQMERIQQS